MKKQSQNDNAGKVKYNFDYIIINLSKESVLVLNPHLVTHLLVI